MPEGRFFGVSPERLALLRERRRREGLEGAGGTIPRRPEGDPPPPAFAQERLWFLDRLTDGRAGLVIPAALRLRGPLRPAALTAALGDAVARHETLRSRFPERDGRPTVEVAPPAAAPLPRLDLDAVPACRRRPLAERLASSLAGHPFDLARGPVWVALLVRLGAEDHALLLAVHHVVADGWSMGVLFRELAAAYEARIAGRPAPFGPPAVRYGDWSAWQRRRLSGERLADEVAWWRRRLAGAPPVLDLPADRPRAPAREFRGGTVRATLEAPAADRLRALGRGLPDGEATPFMVLLAALAVLLARWSGQRDLVVGTPVAGRTRGEVEELVGLFLNHLALRLDLAGDPSFHELLGRVRRVCLDAFAHQEVPFERLLDELDVPRDLATTPLFQVFLNVLNFPAPPRRPVGGLELSPLAPPASSMRHLAPARFDLTLYADDRGPGAPLALDLVYDSRRFDAPRMEEALRQLAAVLEAAAEDPGRPVGSLSLLTAAARRRLPDPGRPQDDGWPGPVHAAVERHAAVAPETPAVIGRAGETITYARLHGAVEGLAGRLVVTGVGRGDVVAVHAHREPALVAAVLAIHRAGAAFLLLDPAHPPLRNAACLRQAAPRLLLRLAGASPLPDELAASSAILALPPLTADGPWPADGPPPPVPLTAGDPAYVAFTSGSTGAPKGVLGLHRSLTHFLPWQADVFSLTAGDRVSMLSGLSHDPLHRDLFTPLWVGAAVAVPDADRFAEPEYLADWARRRGVTVLHATPSLLRLLATGDPASLPALRWAFLLGEALTGADLERLAALAPRALAVNLYGTTETQRAVAWLRAEAGEDAAAVVPLGRGMPDVQLLVLPPHGGRAGVGELGEVAVRSPHLAAGYLGRPADSAAVFVPDPSGGSPGGRLYRTGDLGRYRPDGTVEPLGRRDRQVKVRGHRVEPGEVEAALARHPAVAEAAVVPAADGGALVTYWVAADGADAAPEPDLRAFLAARLPAAMVPAVVVPLAQLPLTPNGKLDRAALPVPAAAQDGAPAVEAPATPSEELLAAVWCEVLELDAVGRGDDFFALGGHSLALTRVLARVRDLLGVELPVRRAFEASTLAAQAAAVDESRREPHGAPPLTPRDGSGDAPVSFAQRRLWFLQRFAPRSTAYTLSAVLHLEGALDAAALHRAVIAVVARQAALRTTLPAPDGVPVQRVAPPAPVPLPRIDLSALPPETRRGEAARRAARTARRRFELERGPLLAVRLLRLGPRSHHLLLAVHHAVADGWSLEVLAAELAEHYSAAVEDRPLRLPPLPVSYADWAAWQRRVLDGDALEARIAWWRRRLAGLPASLDLPTDRPRGAREDVRGSSVVRRLPTTLGQRLEELGRDAGATRFMLLLAALAVVLSRWSGQPRVAVGSPEAGRDRRETEPLVGLFLDLLVLPVDLTGDPSWRDLLTRVRETVLGAFAHRDVPFERLIEELAPQRDPGRHPLFEVLLNVLPAGGPGTSAATPRFAGLDARLEPPAHRDARFPLTLYAGGAGPWTLTLVYRRALFDPARAEELLDQVIAALESMAADLQRPVDSTPLLTARARAVLADPAAPMPAPAFTPVAERFAAVAATHPARPAVVAPEGSWSYRQLAARVERWSAELEPWRGRVVAVQGPTCRDLAAAVVAVLRAGAVLLLVDPALPPARRSEMLETAGAAVVLRLPAGELEELVSNAAPLPADAAYVFFTSGSTGVPKAVLGSHRGLAHFLDWQRQSFGIGAGDRVAQLTALSFDVVLRDLLLPLTSGAALVLPDTELRFDPARVPPWLDVSGVTVLHAVPTPARAWLAEGPAVDLAALRWVFFAGEPLPAALVNDWRRAFPTSPSSAVGDDRGVVNLYGPTETTLARCAWTVPDSPAPGVQPVGRALPDSQALLLWDGRRCAPGEVGEIVLRTPCRSLGHLAAPEEDRRRFFPNPYRHDPEDLLYASGDLGRYRLDGVLEILGRRDRQVKVRGVRVEPGEVEAALTAHPAVAAAVVGTADEGGVQVLAAWVVPVEGAAAEPRRLRAHLSRRLPPALVPARWVSLERLPTTASGKVDRDALPPPEHAGERSARPPRNRLERELAEIFRHVLGVDRVGADDGFFALGGHSLRAVPLLSAIEQRLGVRLPLAALFQRPTVEELAELVRAAGPLRTAYPVAAAPRSGPLVTLQRGGDRPPLVLVHPGGGGVLCYADLARALGPEQPLHALQSVGLDGGEEPLTSIAVMAERYLEALQPVRPAGPWHLGGWSFGGRVAFEMARRLREAGEEVGLLALLDITPDPSPGPAAARQDDDPALLARALADAFPDGAEAELAARLRALDDEGQVAALMDAARAAGRLPDGVAPERAAALFRVFKANMAAARAFRQRPYPGEAVLFRAVGSDRFEAGGDPTGGWGELAAAVRVVRVPGDHHTLVRPPHVARLAAALTRELRRQAVRGSLA